MDAKPAPPDKRFALKAGTTRCVRVALLMVCWLMDIWAGDGRLMASRNSEGDAELITKRTQSDDPSIC
jgi:hypothetical protein